MEKRLEQYLYKKYPDLFKNESKSIKESCMPWGCSCGDGWFFLLDNLCKSITCYIRRQHSQVEYYDDLEKQLKTQSDDTKELTRPDWTHVKTEQVVFDQIKEKFGSLRIYYTGGDDKIESMVNFAEWLSHSICENCGKFDYSIGKTQTGWIQNLCRNCSENDEWKRDWKQSNVELEEIFKLTMEDKEKNKGRELELSLNKIEELKSRDKSDDKI